MYEWKMIEIAIQITALAFSIEFPLELISPKPIDVDVYMAQ
jgi:hypothetical protein